MNKDYFIIIKNGTTTTMLDVREISSVTTDLVSINELVFTISMKNGDKFKTKENVLDVLDEHDKFLQSKIKN